ncbi:proteasome assembly chaperone family protein [Natronosalvus vescus]|uniref:proteasome assembly chaperone family protein n=1 Tax=Natronosalvus vescus TaxID=2953881 RepID=UPI0020905336|nr:PAC2 family protein [Natronosalvus vescus]
MSQIRLQDGAADLENPVLVEGFPGVGLVGKIATDHLIDQLDMRYYASIHCDGLPQVGIYREGEPIVHPPVRLYVSEPDDVLALQSDIPIGAQALEPVADCLTSWIDSHEATPLYLSGLPAEHDGNPSIFGIATGGGRDLLDGHSIGTPPEDGVVSGPTGALLNRSTERGSDSVGLVVECSPQFPDPQAASVLLEDGVCPIADVDVDVGELLNRAAEIREKREAFAQRMREMGEAESTQAQPLRMYQ